MRFKHLDWAGYRVTVCEQACSVVRRRVGWLAARMAMVSAPGPDGKCPRSVSGNPDCATAEGLATILRSVGAKACWQMTL